MKAIKLAIATVVVGAVAGPCIALVAIAGPAGYAAQCSQPVQRTDQEVPQVFFTGEQRAVGQTIADANTTGDAIITSVAIAMSLHASNLADVDAGGNAINTFTGAASTTSTVAQTHEVVERITSRDTWTTTAPPALAAWALGIPSTDLTDEWRQAAVLAAEVTNVDVQLLLNLQAVDPACQRARTVDWDGEYVVRDGLAFPVPVAHNISSPFGYRLNPFTHRWALHDGIDIAAPCGSPIIAAKTGTISRWSENEPGYGTLIEIYHNDGTRTRYAHMYPGTLNYYLGAPVDIGDVIAEVGSAGNSTGCHLHFEVRTLMGAPIDPLPIVGS